MTKKRLSIKPGDLVTVKWLDAAGYTNEPESAAHVVPVENVGYVRAVNKTEIVLQTGNYPDESKARYGDFVAIPRQWCEEVNVIRRAKR